MRICLLFLSVLTGFAQSAPDMAAANIRLGAQPTRASQWIFRVER